MVTHFPARDIKSSLMTVRQDVCVNLLLSQDDNRFEVLNDEPPNSFLNSRRLNKKLLESMFIINIYIMLKIKRTKESWSCVWLPCNYPAVAMVFRVILARCYGVWLQVGGC